MGKIERIIGLGCVMIVGVALVTYVIIVGRFPHNNKEHR